MNAKDKELLYQLYLASLDSQDDSDAEIELPENELYLEEELSFGAYSDERLETEGSIVLIESAGHDICCLITARNEPQGFLAYKLSAFTGLSGAIDLVFETRLSRYLLESDNHFILYSSELENSIYLESLTKSELAVLLDALSSIQDKKQTWKPDPHSPEYLFWLKEHEITLELRSRNFEEPLWIPQYFGKTWQELSASLPLAAADRGTDAIFGVIGKQHDENVYYAREYTLHRNECHDLLLIPDEDYIARKAEIRCGELVVFRGVLPEKLVLASFLPFKARLAQEILKVSLILLKD